LRREGRRELLAKGEEMDWQYLLLSFEGRITRKQFWLTILVFIVIGVVAGLIDAVLHTPAVGSSGIVGLLVSLAMIYPALALYAKRWHDRGKSGWWTLIGLIPIVGAIWLLIELGFLRGTPGANKYGPDPLGAVALAA
jgi:uncharacterized membrane protein YhaH (DUF805 family)